MPAHLARYYFLSVPVCRHIEGLKIVVVPAHPEALFFNVPLCRHKEFR